MVRCASIQERVCIVTVVEEAGGGVRHQDLLLGKVVVRHVHHSLVILVLHRVHALIQFKLLWLN